MRRLVLLAMTLAACDRAPEVGGQSQALDRTHWPTVSGNPLPAMGVTLSESLSMAPGGTGADNCINCSFTNGLDADSSKTLIDQPISAWQPPPLPSSGVQTSYGNMATKAQAVLDGTDSATQGADNISSTLGTIHDLFELIPGAVVDPVSVNKHQWVRAFKPVFGRHLKSSGTILSPQNYANPSLLDELTDRGARSYCAMRNAAIAAPSGSMPTLQNDLTKALFWQLGHTDGDVTLMPIDDKTNRDLTQPGSQAFYMPLAVGADVAPLKGPLVPDFGELSHPLVWVTGDAEVIDSESTSPFILNQYRDIEHYDVFSGYSYSGSVGFHDLQLMDLGLFQVEMGGTINLLAGALEDDALANADGNVKADENTPLPWPSYRNGGGLYDFFGLNTIYQDGNWPAPRQTSFWVSALNQNQSYSLDQAGTGIFDDALGLNPNCIDEIGQPHPFNDYVGTGSRACGITPFPDKHTGSSTTVYTADNTDAAATRYGTAARWRNDDDRAFALRDSLKMQVDIDGAGGFDFGILAIQIVLQVSLDVTSYIDTMVREHLSGGNRAQATVMPAATVSADQQFLQSNVTVTPVGNNSIGIDPLDIMLNFQLGPLPFIGTLQWEPTIFNLGDVLKLMSNPAIASEQNRLRVGEYSELTSTIASETPLASHLPALAGGTAFASMPETVGQCLAEQKAGGHLPTPKPPGPAPAAPPYGLCYYSPSTAGMSFYDAVSMPIISPIAPVGLPQLPGNACSTIGQPGAWDMQFPAGAERNCIQSTLRYLCGQLNGTQSVSHPVSYFGQTVIAHLVQKGVGEDQLSAKMWGQCTSAFVTPNSTFAQNTTQDKAVLNALGQFFLHDFVTVHVCDKNTLQPVGTTPADQGRCTVDPVTHQCWSLPACYIDPATGDCTNKCVAPAGTRCRSIPVPPFCNPNQPVGTLATAPVCAPPPSCTINPTTGACT
jgi:hypothetical protein